MAKTRQALRCKARKRNGDPCGRYAVVGGTVCPSHGGNAPQVRAKAKQRVAEEKAAKAAEKYVAKATPLNDPLTALLKVAGEVSALKDFLADRVAELDPARWSSSGPQGEQIRAIVAAYERALDRTARVLVDINRLGLEDRLLKLQERINDQHAALFNEVFLAVLAEIGLTPEQEKRVPEVMTRHLTALLPGDQP